VLTGIPVKAHVAILGSEGEDPLLIAAGAMAANKTTAPTRMPIFVAVK
jgi:hypothetical protein